MSEQETTFELMISAQETNDVSKSQRNRKILADAYAAVLSGNEFAVFDCCVPDVVFIEAESLPYGCRKVGVEAAKAGVAGAFGAWTHLKCEIEEYVAAGDIVIVYMNVTATARATGEVYEGPTAETFRFNDEGKIIEWRVIYWDTHRVREVCGLS